ncbi:uncharacterized protein LOC116124988 [Pistacia vera]|uniref:Uncharacterized protein n=1 Tax=Pistacia integerrima TaxID=434235 RepID=A0ACC0Z7D4_9ROSI|nr:uncharacterized protein LOC116124988 [Pistacia vera]KAJ0046859.1 hypothetical protein Pint_04626 [Pistacia integerrima]
MSSAIHFFSLSCKPRNPILSTNSSFSTQSTLVTLRSLCFFATLTHSVFFKGCLSMINVERPIRQSVICMARRYAPNSRLRKMKSRKRGGDPEKKRTRKRKRTGKRKGRGETRKKKNVKVIRLASSAGTGFFYAKKKNTKNMKKLDIKKYDPTIKRHVKFAEVKMK